MVRKHCSTRERDPEERHDEVFQPGQEKKVSWSDTPRWCWYTRVPRVQYLMKEEETKSAGSRMVVAVAVLGASKAGGKYQAANGTRIPNLRHQKIRVRNDEGHVCGMGFQIADAVAIGGSWKPSNIQGTGSEFENIKTGRKMTLVRRGGIYVLGMLVAAHAPGFPGRGT